MCVTNTAVPEDPDFDVVDRDEAQQPEVNEAQRRRKASGEARAPYRGRAQKAISERGVIGSLLLGFLVRGSFTLHAADQLDAQGQPLSYTDTDIPVSAGDIPHLNCDNLFRQLCRGLPGDGENTRPSAAVAAVLAAHPDLRARLEAIPQYLSDSNMVDHVGQQLQIAFGNITAPPDDVRKLLWGADQQRGRVVLADKHRTSRVSTAVNGKQSSWSQQRDQPVQGLMWCPVVAPRKPPQDPCSNQEATQPAASEAGASTPPPAKRTKRTKAEQAAEPTQPTKGIGKAKGKGCQSQTSATARQLASLPALPAGPSSAALAAVQQLSVAGVFVLSGLPQVMESLCIAAGGELDTHVLMALAACGTLYLGMAQEGALLLLLFQLSHSLEERFTAQAQGSLQSLLAAVPQEVPLDGRIVWGRANLSMQHVSGESAPVPLAPGMACGSHSRLLMPCLTPAGDLVPAGSVNTDGLLVVKVTAKAEDSTPARIARMAAQAQANRPRLSRVLERVGAVWSKAVVVATLASLLGLVLAGVPLLGPGGALYRCDQAIA
ncbi:hypothetical protein QJQ45_028424 [Haematococcus lacustris]|nr:hypothetical protein QJQ45_028424 [Haematococcus lacustris]